MAEQGPDRDLAATLLAWYGSHARDLPWRAKPGVKPDPYRVWLSEIMLQQTTVGAVKDYFLKFTSLWPNVEALAAAPLDDILKAWAGLGYYARARNLHACAKAVVAQHGGRFPETVEGLRALPGIGPYTAGAITAIAFDQRAAAVDGNVERVMSRLYAIETPLPRAKPEILAKVATLVPKARAGDFAQALMDLGATICTPKRLNCLICPWAEHCEGRKRGIADSLPRKAAKKQLPIRKGIAFWVEREDGSVLLRRRPEKGLLGGMMEVCSTEWTPIVDAIDPPVSAAWQKNAGRIEHTFTHFHLELEIWWAEGVDNNVRVPSPDFRWVSRADLHAEALPTVMKKIVKAMQRASLFPALRAGKREN
jgi:A/G-specific adenine glycosylase